MPEVHNFNRDKISHRTGQGIPSEGDTIFISTTGLELHENNQKMGVDQT